MFYLIDLQYICFFIYIFFWITLAGIIIALDHFIVALVFLDLLLLVNIILMLLFTATTGFAIGYNYALLLLGVAAADTAVGLGLFILYFKTSGAVSIK